MSKEILEVTPGRYKDSEQVIYRKAAECFIAPELLLGLLQGKYEADPALFPEDAHVIGARWDDVSCSLRLLIASDTYYAASEGAAIFAISLRLRKKE